MIKIEKDTIQWEKMKKRLLRETKELRIGWFPDAQYGDDNDNLFVAQVAQFNEEGTVTNPTRPFIREGFMRPIKKGLYNSYFTESMQRIAEGTSTFTKEYTKLGPMFVADMQEVIEEWSIPSNSLTTIQAKGFDNPLIDSGTMHDTVSFEVANKSKMGG